MCPGEAARGNCNGTRIDRAGAGNVVGCVAEDENALGGKRVSVLIKRARTGNWSKGIAVVVIVSIGAELEKVPDPVVRELEFRAADEIPGEQREYAIRTGS